MGRRVLAVTTFIWAMIAFSQLSFAQVIVNGTVTSPAVSANTVLLGNGPTTPTLTYAAPGPTAGISNAGRAGISNSAPLPSTFPANDTVVYYSQPGVQPMIVLPGAVEGAGPVATMPAEGTEAAPAENVAGESSGAGGPAGKAFDDFGPSSFGGTMFGGTMTSTNGSAPEPSANSMSLGQVAAQYKAGKASLNARALTNQDVDQMLSNKAGVTVAKNMPPLGPSAMPSGLTQGGASQSQPQNAPASAQPAQSGTTVRQTGTPPPAEATQAQPTAPTATAGATTTPQVNPSQQSNDAQGKSKLPSTATFLPLLGLLGLVSGGIGLLVRRFRR